MHKGNKVVLGRRPLSFYGPDDWDGITPWHEIEKDIQARQREWDAQYLALPLWSRFKLWLSGAITEPVGTSAGVSLPDFQAEPKATEDARQPGDDRKEAELRATIELCEAHWETLTPKERSLVSGCRFRLNAFGLVSEKQAIWLLDIAKQLQPGN